MKIFDISVKNFRGIKSAEKIKCGSINTIVGRNDAGKSALIKALNVFFTEKFKPEDIFQGKSIEENTEVIIRFDTNSSINDLALDFEGKLAISKIFYFDKNGKAKTEMYYICNDILHETVNNCWGVKEEELNAYITTLGETPTRSGRGVTNLSKIERIQELSMHLSRVEKKYKADEFWKNITKQYSDIEMPIFSIFEAEQNLNIGTTDFQGQFKQLTTASLEKNKDLTDRIEKEVTTDLTTEFDIITSFMQKNVPDIDKIEPRVNCNWSGLVKFDIDLKFKNENYSVPISNKGTGFKRLLMVAYFEYLATRQTAQHQIFAIEEPETYLHPSLQEDLLNSITTISQNSQFFLTTHSPVYAGATNQSNIIVVQKDNSLSNYLNIENEDDLMNLVISELGIRPNYNLLKDHITKVVFVEGSSDVKFWECAIAKIHGTLPNNILFVPCGGTQVGFFVDVSLCRKINKNFMFVLDSDKGATDYSKKLQNQNGLKLKIEAQGGTFEMLCKREIENYYHIDAIKRAFPNINIPDDFEILDHNDIEKEIKDKILSTQTTNLKKKGEMKIFNEMTQQEWINSGFMIDENKTDVITIIEKILDIEINLNIVQI